ncbi:APC family permease [Cellulomonas composti]|uniref:APC family permease n=1 Tax=Cellulomonas composti TaxID=266130 RepID=UPI0011BEEF9C|nr:APC family permease [Cellulomonas composti]
MSDLSDAAKRLLIGRPVRSEHLGHTLLPKRIALPVFASDALSSVAYAPDEILLTLSIAGMSALVVSPWVGIGVAIVLATVVASYRQNVHAYPSGGGDYEVATVNLGPNAGVTVASALLVDYILTVAVSISSGAQYAASAFPALRGHEAQFAIVLVVLLTVVNLRGVKESGRAFAAPVYLFMFAIGSIAVVGTVRHFLGTLPMAESAELTVAPQAGWDQGLVGLAGFFLVLRAFASGCAALTGVEAISNGVPAFRKPKSRNAATTLALLGTISIVMILSILFLARATGVKFADRPHEQLLLPDGATVGPDYTQHPVISQLASAVFQGMPVLVAVISIVTGLILVLAANTAFNGFPVLGSILARDGYLPRQLHTRGDRLAFSNGIVTLALVAIVLIWAFDAQVTRLIQLYIVGVFVSFTLSQLGMVRHWTRGLRTEPVPATRSRMKRSRVVNTIGLGMTGTVLVIVLLTKFTHGAWIAILAMIVVFVLMQGIHKHYVAVRRELALGQEAAAARALPSRVHAIVLVSHLHRPTMRAIAYARASRPNVLEAVTVGVDPDDVAQLRIAWDEMDLPVQLRVLDSPFREITRPVLQYVRSIRRDSPRDLVVVYIPEYVVGHWWEQLLHNQSALRLKGRLLFTPGVVVASVPWQLASSAGQTGLEEPDDRNARG